MEAVLSQVCPVWHYLMLELACTFWDCLDCLPLAMELVCDQGYDSTHLNSLFPCLSSQLIDGSCVYLPVGSVHAYNVVCLVQGRTLQRWTGPVPTL